MIDEYFAVTLTVVFGFLFNWAFKNLPKEEWQVMAVIPVKKNREDRWKGINLTYYGMFNAVAIISAVFLYIVLLSSILIPLRAVLAIAVIVLLFCLPGAKLIARLVEGKPQTLTVGGASFLGAFIAPIAIILVGNTYELDKPLLPCMAALGIAYTLGEGVGRLACISFGCCYGRPLEQCGPWIHRYMQPYSFVFSGELKKIAYEKSLHGKEVVPVQAITATLYVLTAITSTLLFLKGYFIEALTLSIGITQIWRILSEFLRADYRGNKKISDYQFMAIVSLVFVLIIGYAASDQTSLSPDLKKGLAAIWDPSVILFLQLVGLAGFLLTGRSMVTDAELSLHLIKKRT